ncbi:MAG: glycosyltransferase family 4 protein [Bacteroidia bacterium]|nr:glycosyltransferase family 4 protein [Bacteroidia bacterium]
MQILHLSSEMTWRGGEQQIAWLIRELNVLTHRSHVFCPKDSVLGNYCINNEIPVTQYKKGTGISLPASRKYARLCRSIQPDIVHIHDSNSQTTSLIAWHIWGIKLPLVLSRRVDFPIATNIFSAWKYNHRSICKIICVSKAIDAIVRPKIRQKEKIVIIHDGIDVDRFPPHPTRRLRDLIKVDDQTTILGNVAALVDHKDHSTFIKVASLISVQNPEAKFVIIGEDLGQKKMLQNLATSLDLSDKIYFLGFRKDIPDLIGDMNVFLFTSKTEGLGSALMDAMAAGLPIVATNAGGIGEIVEHQKSGWIADVGSIEGLAQGVRYVLDNPKKVQNWIASGKAMAQNYSACKMASSTLEVYQNVLDSFKND